MGVGQVQELVPKLGSKEEEISETNVSFALKNLGQSQKERNISKYVESL